MENAQLQVLLRYRLHGCKYCSAKKMKSIFKIITVSYYFYLPIIVLDQVKEK